MTSNEGLHEQVECIVLLYLKYIVITIIYIAIETIIFLSTTAK